ncbi:MAG: tRNA 2-thiouridine(34) synthase MnmA [Candidatus Sericytochromatia bacterium]|nr:tRNA 2-thiouridine(34) synthase MnmA [Candidatus Sericytochromatia bacterium]
MRIAVGLSGGVDSSLAAARLVAEGHDVVGVTMVIWPDSSCCGAEAIADASALADRLGIPHLKLDLMEQFKAEVVDPFLKTYADGRTPNPCPTCNEKLKFDHMWQAARAQTGAEYLATGHYARVSRDDETGRWQLRSGLDPRKDQAYMLWRLTQEQLSRLLTPLGSMTKDETRREARALGLYVADKPDSQDLCFTSQDLSGFLARHLPEHERPGPIVDLSGQVLGAHRGTTHYTVGQRRGLGVAAPQPLYVLDVLPEERQVVVGTREQTMVQGFGVEDVRWVSVAEPAAGRRVEVRVRHGGQLIPAELSRGASGWRVGLDAAVPGVAPGQYAVFHDGDLVLGGGTITRDVVRA